MALKFVGKGTNAYNGSQTGGGSNIKTVYKWEDVTNPKLLKLKGK